MIYLDPPFLLSKFKNQEQEIMKYLFNDKWSSINDYIYYMEERLNECKKNSKKNRKYISTL